MVEAGGDLPGSIRRDWSVPDETTPNTTPRMPDATGSRGQGVVVARHAGGEMDDHVTERSDEEHGGVDRRGPLPGRSASVKPLGADDTICLLSRW